MKKILLALSVLSLSSVHMYAQQQDKLLGILRGELQYDMQELQKQPVKPYYMSLRVEDIYSATIISDFGVISTSDDIHTRYVVPQIRLGDKELDNFKYTTQGDVQQQGRPPHVTTIPLNDEATDGIRADIWSETLRRYDIAMSIYEQTKSKATTSVASEDKANCFSNAKTEHYYEEPLDAGKLQLNRKVWEQRLNSISAVFQSFPELQRGSASLSYEVSRVYFVNTDGTEVVQNRVSTRVMLTAGMTADDGMQLPLMQDFFAYDIDSLPSIEAMTEAATDLVKRIRSLKEAPVANPYTGPAILSGAASGVFFHEIFGHRLEGHRLKEGGETFKNMVGKSVLPQDFQVYCDPTLRRYAGTDLNGYYLYDSEGVKGRRVDNVVNGELREFLMSRVPLDGFPQSNGHGRATATNDPVSRQSNLIVETHNKYTDAQLRQMLKTEAKKQGKEYGYFFKTVTSGYTTTGQGGTLNSFNVTPVEVYRIYVDGRPDELVRGVDLIGTPLSMFSHIAAGGDTPSTFTGSCGAESGWVPVTATSPEIFVTQIETQRREKSKDIPPILHAPTSGGQLSESDADSIIFTAMKDEMTRTRDSLAIAGSPRPFYVSYITNRYRKFDITSELGGISQKKEEPWRLSGNCQVMVGNFKRNSEIQMPLILNVEMPLSPDYTALRRGFWASSDAAYKTAINFHAQKTNYLMQNPLPKALEKIPDMQRVAPGTYTNMPEPSYNIDMPTLEKISCELSAIFCDYPQLYNTSVTLSGAVMDVYRTTTENVNIKQPQSYVSIKAKATFRDADNMVISDELTLSYDTPSEIPSLEELKVRVRRFADDAVAMREAPALDEYYKGPIMYEQKAASFPFTGNLLQPSQLYAQQSLQQNPKSLGQKLGKKILDSRISVVNYSDKATYNGQLLMGRYDIDADGIKPSPETVVVEKGIFKQMLNRTTPAEYAEQSTGSSRFANNVAGVIPTIGVGTLHIKTDGTTDARKMEAALIKAAKKAKQDYAYVISCPENYANFRLYRINVKTGERTLMKTDQIALPTLTQLEKLIAISNEESVMNDDKTYNHSIVYPSAIIIEEGELNKPTMKSSRTPALKYPLQR